MTIALLIIHGLVAVALLGAITHQTLAAWAPAVPRQGSFFGRFRSIPPASFANAIVVLYLAAALLGAGLYWYFRIDVRPALERSGQWPVLGLFDLKEHFISIGLGMLPAYWVLWRRPAMEDSRWMPAILTALLAFIVWWAFLVGHVVNNIMGFGQ